MDILNGTEFKRDHDSGTCSGDKVFYSCHGYRGCCSIDFCTLGFCRDWEPADDDESSSSSATPSSTSWSTSSSTRTSSTTTSTDETTTSESTSSTISSSPDLISATSDVAPPVTGTPTNTFITTTRSTVVFPTSFEPDPTTGVHKDIVSDELDTHHIVGIAVGATAGVIPFMVALFVLFKIRRSKSIPNFRVITPVQTYQGNTRAQQEADHVDNGAADVFAPFGGRFQSRRFPPDRSSLSRTEPMPGTAQAPIKQDHIDVRHSFLGTRETNSNTSARNESPAQPPIENSHSDGGLHQVNQCDAARTGTHWENNQASQLDSTPIYVELEPINAAGPPQPSPESPIVSPMGPDTAIGVAFSGQGRSQTTNALFTRLNESQHPSPLTPGTPGTELDIQKPRRASSMPPGRDAVDDRRFSALGEKTCEAKADAPEESMGVKEEELKHRATLNATEEERENNQHATSWAQL